jgi:AAA domain
MDVLDPATEADGATEADRVTRLAESFTAQLVDTDGLDSLPEADPLLRDLLARDSLAWIYGKPGSGKSFVALDWAGCIAGGIPWQRHEVVTPGPVLYIGAEGAHGVRRRVRAWEALTGLPMAGVSFLPVAPQLLDTFDMAALTRLVETMWPVLIVVDTQARTTVGAEENSARDMGRVVDAADRLRSASRACVLLVHHEGRNGEHPRGSSAVDGAADAIFRVTKDGPWVRVDNVKQKDGTEAEVVLLRLTATGESAVLQSHEDVGLAAELSASEDRILGQVRESFGTTGASTTVLREAAQLPKSSFYRALNLLVSRGMLRNVGTVRRPHYVLPASEDET